MDDESYFTLDHSTLAGNNVFYSDNIDETPEDVKHNLVTKHEAKLLVWVAFRPNGISKPFFGDSGNAINSDIYQDECIQKRLLPFIKESYKQQPYVFWPDQAISHYSKKVVGFLDANSVKYLPKSINPTNLPEVRTIEDFWGELKRDVYENDWKAKTISQLQVRINLCLKNFDMHRLWNLATDVRRRLRIFRDTGDVKGIHK